MRYKVLSECLPQDPRLHRWLCMHSYMRTAHHARAYTNVHSSLPHFRSTNTIDMSEQSCFVLKRWLRCKQTLEVFCKRKESRHCVLNCIVFCVTLLCFSCNKFRQWCSSIILSCTLFSYCYF